MVKTYALKKTYKLIQSSVGFLCLGLMVACGPSDKSKVDAEIACSQYASSQSGYTPANPPGGKSSIGKGAATGAIGGAAIGAASSNKSSKTLKGAAVGAAAGAGLGALKNKEDKKKAEQSASAYQSALQDCMAKKGF